MNKNDTLAAYRDFTKWCRDNPHLGLDSRLHSHSGPIGYGGYISHEKTAVAFAAWRAAIEADRARAAEAEHEQLAAPQPAPDASALVEALEEIERWVSRWCADDHPVATFARKALAAHRKQGGSHDQ